MKITREERILLNRFKKLHDIFCAATISTQNKLKIFIEYVVLTKKVKEILNKINDK